MTDREMLEFAAKAAGLRLDELGGRIVRREIDGQPVYWNPLTDDGDALRLAAKLGIDVMHTNIHSPQVHAMADYDVACIEDSATDPYAATRRAIVRAAAGIGRSKT
jgi:hypothetical protein